MEISELNRYLSKLEGPGFVQSLDARTDELTIKFCGNTGGPYDDGEIELTFNAVEIIHLPLSLVLPVQMEQSSPEHGTVDLNINYKSDNCSMYLIKDDVGSTWHIYAGSYSVKVLPVFWQRP